MLDQRKTECGCVRALKANHTHNIKTSPNSPVLSKYANKSLTTFISPYPHQEF